MQSKGELGKQTPSIRLSTSPTLCQNRCNWSIVPHLDTSPLDAPLSPLGSHPSQHHQLEVCTPAATVITHRSAWLQHKVTSHGPG